MQVISGSKTNMDKIKRFIDCYIPTQTCNLRCRYCYIAQNKRFEQKITPWKYGPGIISKAMAKERLGGICMLNLCAGGETLLSPEIVPAVRGILEQGHYVSVITNGTISKKFDELANFPPSIKERLFIKFSFHHLELKRLNLMQTFIDNVKKTRKAGIAVSVEITPEDELIPYIEEIKELSVKEFGALPHITIARKDNDPKISVLSSLPEEEFFKTWQTFNSPMLDFKKNLYGVKRTEFCHAGDWSFYINLGTGLIGQCYCGQILGNFFENPHEPFKPRAIGNNCTLPYCYNGHAFLTFGDIAEINAVPYSAIRNRITASGEQWLTEKVKVFMDSRLSESNAPYTEEQKTAANAALKNKGIKAVIKKIIQKLKEK